MKKLVVICIFTSLLSCGKKDCDELTQEQISFLAYDFNDSIKLKRKIQEIQLSI